MKPEVLLLLPTPFYRLCLIRLFLHSFSSLASLSLSRSLSLLLLCVLRLFGMNRVLLLFCWQRCWCNIRSCSSLSSTTAIAPGGRTDGLRIYVNK